MMETTEMVKKRAIITSSIIIAFVVGLFVYGLIAPLPNYRIVITDRAGAVIYDKCGPGYDFRIGKGLSSSGESLAITIENRYINPVFEVSGEGLRVTRTKTGQSGY